MFSTLNLCAFANIDIDSDEVCSMGDELLWVLAPVAGSILEWDGNRCSGVVTEIAGPMDEPLGFSSGGEA